MKLGLFLAIGESLENFNSKGQLKRLVDYNIKKYSNSFDEVYIFSYGQQKFPLPANCKLITNKLQLHRYIYAILMPLINFKYIKECDVFRSLQLTGGIPALITKIIFQKKFVLNFGYDYVKFAQIEKKYFQSLLYGIIQWPILNLADCIITPTKTIFKNLGKNYKSKVVYIPNGVDLMLFHPIIKKANNKLSIVFLGRLESQKNLHNLLNALKPLRFPYDVTFYGEGSEKKELSTLANKLGVPLKLESPIDYEKVAKVLRQSDIFVLPSYTEGSSKILLEAMASGCAIVASDITEISQIVKNDISAMLCKPDSKSILRAINKLKNFKIRLKVGKNARKLVEENYEIGKLLTMEVEILKSMYEK